MLDRFTRNHNNILWSKWLAEEPPHVDPFTEKVRLAVAVHCVQENTGFSVWYDRSIDADEPLGVTGTKNGAYLLKFFGPSHKNNAIEFAVRSVLPDQDPKLAIAHLDGLAAQAELIE